MTVKRALEILLNPSAATVQGEGRETIVALEGVREEVFAAMNMPDPTVTRPEEPTTKNEDSPAAPTVAPEDVAQKNGTHAPTETAGPVSEKKKRGRPQKVIPAVADAGPALSSVKWTLWTPAMKCTFLAEVSQAQKKKKEGAIKRVSDAYGVPAGKYSSWKEEFPNGFVPPAPEPPVPAPAPVPVLMADPAEPIEPNPPASPLPESETARADEALQAAPDSTPEPGSAVADAPSEPTVTDMKVDQAESPVRNYVPDEMGITALANSVHRLMGVESIDHATLVRTLCSAFGKLAYDIARSVHSEDNTGWSHNLLKSKAIGALIDIAANFTGTKEEFPDHARPLIRQCLLLLPKSRQ